MWISCQDSDNDNIYSHPQTIGSNARLHPNSANGQLADITFEENYVQDDNLKSNFVWEADEGATDNWNIPTMDGAKKGQTIQSGRLEKPQIRPCRLPGIDSVGALRPQLKPITAGKACVSWGDSECRLGAIDDETGCFNDSPDCGIASR